jgi:ubiquinone/menaquinone biosynthesis C-methylase UbiE
MHTQEPVATNDDIQFASQFPEYREKNIREPVERYTIHNCMLKSLLDDNSLLTGKRVLDLACGHGHYTRQLKALDCGYILGVDLSSMMINIARDIERRDPKGIEYSVNDVTHLSPPEQTFDLVTGFYLFDYARTVNELLQMVRTVFTQLGDGKQFIGIIGNVVAGKDMFNQRKYGITRETKVPLDEGPISDGTEMTVTLYNERDEPTTPFVNYHYSPTTYAQIFKEVGFKALEWVPYQYDNNAPNRNFFDDLINCAPSIGMIATK